MTLGGSNDTVALGVGADTVSMGGGSDTVNGTLGVGDTVNMGAGNDTFAYQALGDLTNIVDGDADVDTLTVGAGVGLTIDFTATTDNIAAETGAYRNFENLAAGGADTAIDVKLTAGSNSIVTGSAADSIRITDATFDLGDTINGGTASDTLFITGGGTVNILTGVTVTGIENVNIDNTATSFTANNENLAITAGDGGNTIVLGTGTQSVAGTMGGADSVTVGSGSNNVATGAGDDTINVTATTYSGDTLDGGSGGETLGDLLAITGGGTVNMTLATISNIERVSIDNTATVFVANNDNLAITAGDGGNDFTLGSGTQSVTSGTGADTVALGGGANSVNTGDGSDTVNGTVQAADTVDLNAGNDTFAYQVLAGSVSGGGGGDTLTVTGAVGLTIDFSNTADNIAAESGTYSNFENLSAGDATLAFTVTAAAAGSTITTGSGADTVTLNSGVDTVSTGGGNDTVNGALSAADTVNLGANDDRFIFSLAANAANSVDGGSGSDTLEIGSGFGALSIDLSVLGADQVSGTGTFQNFEHVAASAANGSLTVTDLAGQANNIATGSAGDIIIVSDSNVGGSIDAGASGDELRVTNGATVDMTASTFANFENVTLIDPTVGTTGVTLIANTTANLNITGSSGNDDITVGASTQVVLGGAGDDTFHVTSATLPNTLNGGSNGANGDTLVISGGGTLVFASITGVETVETGTSAVTLTLNNRGYEVILQGGEQHTVASGDNSLGDDRFVFNGSTQASWAGKTVTINNFLEGANNDDLDLLNIALSFDGNVTGGGAAVNTALNANGAVFDQDTGQLKVDINGDGNYVLTDDLTVTLGGVSALTDTVDIITGGPLI